MDTREKVVSRLVNELRSLNADEVYNRRTLLQILEDKARFLLAQKLQDRTLYRESQIFSHIKCFELEKVEFTKCKIAEFRNCKTIMRSKKKLPEIIASKFGEGILNVTSIEFGGQILTPMSLRDYASQKLRKYAHIPRYTYIVHDGYLYITDNEIYAVDLDILTLRTEQIDEISGCSENKDCCKSYWEYPLVNSDKLAEAVYREALQEAVGTFRNIPVDENPNKDSNIKSKTTN